jgi:prepilin-type N-terminal cleavage/methylation domain-containing protein
MNRIQRGFTLIELVMVIVIIGILAAIAIPKFTDLSGEANQAAVNGVAGALSSAAAINYAARKAGNTTATALANCTGVAAMLQGGVLPTGYTITANTITAEDTEACTLTGPGTAPTGARTATFTATGVL